MTVIPLRSMLFVPADSEKKLAKADGCVADAVILDLEDSVVPQNKAKARQLARDFLLARPPGGRALQLWVRINALDSSLTLADLDAIATGCPDGVMLPKTNGPDDVLKLSNYLDAFETAHSVPIGSIRIIPVVTETAVALFHLGGFSAARLERLAGLTWGAEDLSAALGASRNVDASGEWSFTYKLARSLTLLAANAAGVQPLETLYTDFSDDEGLREACHAARAEGFTGRLAIHPTQIAGINACFMPSQDEIAYARRVLDAFAASPTAGAVGLDGKMLDIPHRKRAERVMDQAQAFGRTR